jgi:hypothetical protein
MAFAGGRGSHCSFIAPLNDSYRCTVQRA